MRKLVNISRRVVFQAIKDTLFDSATFAEKLKLRVELRLQLAEQTFLLVVAKHFATEVPENIAANLVKRVVLAGEEEHGIVELVVKDRLLLLHFCEEVIKRLANVAHLLVAVIEVY